MAELESGAPSPPTDPPVTEASPEPTADGLAEPREPGDTCETSESDGSTTESQAASCDEHGRRHSFFRCWVVRPLFWGVAALAILFFVLQPLLDTRWARDQIRTRTAQAIGQYFERKVEIADLRVQLVPLSVEIWGFTIHGPPELPEDAIFLDVPFTAIESGDLLGLYRRRVHLRQIRVERPKVQLVYTPEDLHNIINFRSKNRTNRPRRWDVFIDRLEVDRTEFALDQEKVRLSLAADAVQLRMEGLGELKLAGRAVAQNVMLRLPNARPFEVAVSARGVWQRRLLEVELAEITAPGLQAFADGTCTWSRDDPLARRCQIAARGTGGGAVLEELGYFSDLVGAFDFEGGLDWRPGASGWRGRVWADELEIWDRRLSTVEGTLAADRQGARFRLERANYANGVLEGDIVYDHMAEGRPTAVDLDFRGLELDTLMADQKIPAEGCASRVDGSFYYAFPLSGSRRGSGRAELRMVPDLALPGIPLAGRFPLRIETGVIHADTLTLQSPRQGLVARGHYDLEALAGRFDYEVASADLAELAPLLPIDQEPQPLWLPSAGQGQLEGTLHLSPGEATTDLRLRLEQVVAPALSSGSVRGRMHLDGRAASDLELRLGDGDEALAMRGRIPFADDDPEGLSLVFDGYDWPMDKVHPWLDFDLPLDGRVSGRLRLSSKGGSSRGDLDAEVRPARIRIDDDEGAMRLDVDRLETALSWDAEGLDFRQLDFEGQSGRVEGAGSYRWADGGMNLFFRSPALDLAAEPLRSFLPRDDLGGQVAVGARVGGTWLEPALELELDALGLAIGDRRLEGRPSHLDARWQGGDLAIEGRLLELVSVAGGGRLDRRLVDLDVALAGEDLAGLLELAYETPPEIDGRFAGRLSLVDRVGDSDPADAVLSFDDVALSLREHQVAPIGPVVVRLGEAITLERFDFVEPSTRSEFFFRGTVGYDAETPVDLQMQATLDSGWLEYFELGFEVQGQFDVLGRVGGTFGDFTLDGQAELRRGRLALGETFPYWVEEVHGLIQVFPEAVVIESLDGVLAQGPVSLTGRADFTEDSLLYRLQAQARDLHLRYPEGWLLRGDLDLNLRSGAEGHIVDGEARLDGIEYSDDVRLDFEQLMRGFLRRQRLEVAPADSLLSSIDLDVDIAGPVAIRNNLAELEGTADLLLRGNLAEPVLFGELDLAPGGKLLYNSTEYELERGRVVFRNPYELDPEIDFVATTRVRDFDVNLALTGTFDRLDTRFSSEPPLPDLEVFRLLATGEDLVETSSFEPRLTERTTEDPSTSAAVFLYGQAASVIGERVNRLFGFDKFRIDPLTGSGDNLSKARVTVGKRLSKDVFVTLSVDPSSTENQRLQVEWQVGGGLVLVLTQNGDDTYSADARWETVF